MASGSRDSGDENNLEHLTDKENVGLRKALSGSKGFFLLLSKN
jgi:hypothetical protein